MTAVGKATTQWQDYAGTVALDGEGPASTFLLDEANLDSKDWAVIGFEFFAAQHSQFTTLYVVPSSALATHDGIPGMAKDLGAVPVVAYQLPSDRVTKALTSAFRQWDIRATRFGVPIEVTEERDAR